MTIQEAQSLLDRFGGHRERCQRIVGFDEDEDGEVTNVVCAVAHDGSTLGAIAWRPHKPSPETIPYDEHGLFICG